jgi:hypothetical protein
MTQTIPVWMYVAGSIILLSIVIAIIWWLAARKGKRATVVTPIASAPPMFSTLRGSAPVVSGSSAATIDGDSARNLAEFMVKYFTATPLDVYRSAPSDARSQRVLLGSTIFGVICCSAIFGGLAYGDIWGPVAGIIAGIVILFLYKLIDVPLVKAIDKDWAKQIADGEKNVKRISGPMIPGMILRLILISITGALVSTFFMMLIMKPEISEKIAEKRTGIIAKTKTSMNKELSGIDSQKAIYQNKYEVAQDRYQEVITNKRAEIVLRRAILNQRVDELVGEIEGRIGSGLSGDGPAAAEKRSALKRDSIAIESMQKDLDSNMTLIPEYAAQQKALELRDKEFVPLNAQRAEIIERWNAKIVQLQKQKMDGLLQRIDALHEVAQDNPLYWMYFAFFFLLECMCMIVKILMGPDAITYALAMQLKEYIADVILEAEKAIARKELDFYNHMNSEIADIVARRNSYQDQQIDGQEAIRNRQRRLLHVIGGDLDEIKSRIGFHASLSPAEQAALEKKIRKDYLGALLA